MRGPERGSSGRKAGAVGREREISPVPAPLSFRGRTLGASACNPSSVGHSMRARWRVPRPEAGPCRTRSGGGHSGRRRAARKYTQHSQTTSWVAGRQVPGPPLSPGLIPCAPYGGQVLTGGEGGREIIIRLCEHTLSGDGPFQGSGGAGRLQRPLLFPVRRRSTLFSCPCPGGGQDETRSPIGKTDGAGEAPAIHSAPPDVTASL